MNEISHRLAKRLICKEADARLPEEQWTALQNHLEGCVRCRAYRQRLGSLQRGLRRFLRARWEAQPGPPVEAASQVVSAQRARSVRRRRAAWTLAPLLAALLFWLMGGPVWVLGLLYPVEETIPAGVLPDPTATPIAAVQPGDFPGVVAFAARAQPGADSEIYLLNPGAPPVNLTNHPGQDSQPAWSPDGEWIAFLSDRSDAPRSPGAGEVFVTNLTGSRLVQLTHEPGITWQGPLSWSHDGRWIALTGIREEQGRQSWVYLVSLQGADLVALADTRGAWSPKFAPYGNRLAFATSDNMRSGIAIYHLDSEARALANWPENSLAAGPLAEASFDWSRDGSALAYIGGKLDEERGGAPRTEAGSRVVAVRDLNYAIARFYDFEHNFRVADSTWPNAFRAVTWTQGGAVVYLESLRDARARPAGEAREECWRVQSRLPGFRGEDGIVEQIGGLCLESGFDSGSWTPDGRWLVALGRTGTESSPGLYALRVDSTPFGSQRYRPPEDTVETGTVLRLTGESFDFSLPGALPRVRPRLRTYQPLMAIDPQPVVLMRYNPPPSDLSQAAGGKIAYVLQTGQMSMVVSANPDGTGGQLLFASPGQNRCPRWSPDGRLIALLSRSQNPDVPLPDEGGSDQPIDPSHPAQPLEDSTNFGLPEVEDLYLIDAGGGAARPVLHGALPGSAADPASIRYECPVWSPAGTPGGPYLAALVSDGERSTLAVLPVDGDWPPRYVAVGEPVPGAGPLWAPDGRSLYLAEHTTASRLLQLVKIRLPEAPGSPLTRDVLSVHADWEQINGLAVQPGSPYLGLVTLDNMQDNLAVASLRLVASASGVQPPGERGPLVIGQVDTRGAQRESRLTGLPGGNFGLVLHSGSFARHKALLVLYDPQRQRLTVLAELEDRLDDLAWSPDGRWLIYATESGLWGLDIEGARANRAAPVWLSPVPVQDLDWR